MMKVEFDSKQFGDDVHAWIHAKGHGAAQDIIKESGVAHASFWRMVNGSPVKNINIILSVCAAIGFNFNDYILPKQKVQPRPKGIELEIIGWETMKRGIDRGYATRDFFIAGRPYRWFGNVITPLGLIRVGILNAR
jgi:hypothetical protein